MAYTSFKDSNVLFLQGSQTNLNNLISEGGAKEGAFYLTNDTHRLYIGRNNGTKVVPVAVNEGVVTVAAVENLPTSGVNAGEFYYATKENILCVYNGSQFIQINQDRNTINSSMSTTIKAENNSAEITQAVTDTNQDSVSTKFVIKDSTGNNKIEVEEATNDVYAIDIQGNAYELNTSHENNNLTIQLNSSNTSDNDTSVTLKGGSNITIAEDGTISSTYENTTNDSVSLVLNNDGTLTVTITDSSQDPVEATSAAILYKVNGETVLPGNELPVYSKGEMDVKFRGLNGMSYKGTVTSIPVAAENISAGDTYMVTGDSNIQVSSDLSYDGIGFTAKKGDLLIATGDENEETGFLTNIKWSYVPSGDDSAKDTTYSWVASANDHSLNVTNEDNNDHEGGIQLVAGTAISLSSTAENDSKDLKTTINHGNVGHESKSETINGAKTFDAITGITVNEQGHVTEVVTSAIEIVDSTYELSEPAVSAIEKGIKITTELTTDINPSDSNLSITSDTLVLTAGTNAYSVDIAWGEF